ncbi:MAG: SDR family oxidoreductase [Gemmatimonadetes bacterium]|nr:SDR family oxidoreductase [Gemmatimonadota bacterium]
MSSIAGKNAIVCGSTQGIGKACAVKLAAEGANVTLLARDEETLRSVCDELPGDGKHGFMIANFDNTSAVEMAAESYIKNTGSCHILINNTGGPPAGPILSAAPGEFIAAFNRHLICNHILAQAFIPGMKEESFGRIVNIVSTSVRQPIEGLGVSNTVRGAVASWAKTLSNEVAQFGITVNNVLPGFTDTARLRSQIATKARDSGISAEFVQNGMIGKIPAGRIGAASEIAEAVAFLASAEAGYITGLSLPVDGGRIPTI